MITRRELEQAIAETERSADNYAACEKLATFYTVHDHLYSTPPEAQAEAVSVVYTQGDTEFQNVINGAEIGEFLAVMQELMDVLQATNPRLYDGVIRRLAK